MFSEVFSFLDLHANSFNSFCDSFLETSDAQSLYSDYKAVGCDVYEILAHEISSRS
jgi:hypothetical protein